MSKAIFWFRRDLRLSDNAALYHALKSGSEVLPIFIFDTNILDKLTDRRDARVHFLHQTIAELKAELRIIGSDLYVFYGKPFDIWQNIVQEIQPQKVFSNHDYEPYALERDSTVKTFLNSQNIDFHTFKDHVIFEYDEVTKDDGLPYTVFTPYSKKWRTKLESGIYTEGGGIDSSFYLKSYPTEKYFSAFAQNMPHQTLITLSEMGFEPSDITFPSKTVARSVVRNYDKTRDIPSLAQGTTHLGIHFRFGTVSIREKARAAQDLNQTFLNELIWRDFYAMILQHFPHIGAGKAFREAYDTIEWRNNEAEFEKWCAGKTGYPMVDAGMRELNATGYMHNRVRMIVSSFLTKHLLIDWRWGEAYFAQKLLDFDFASNNGGWQWASGSGTDAAPYFRIFNPETQREKFDKDWTYVRCWVKEFGTPLYPKPIVEHKSARERCLETYKKALKSED